MATKLSSSSLVLCVLAMCAVNMAYAASSSSNNAPAPSVDCSNLILAMADCLSYVTNGSTVPTPEGTCCSALKNVLKTAPQCLFEAFKSSARFGVVLNVTKALDLPAACKVSASSVDNYGLTEAPAAPPAAGSLPLESSPAPTSGSAALGSTGPIGELSPTAAPSPGNAASAFFLISAMFLFLCLSISQSIIHLKLTDNDLREIKEEKITNSLWKPSKEEYSTETSSNKLYQRKRLYTFKYSGEKSMQEHIDDFNKMISDVGVAGIEVEDVDQALILLASVPSSNNNLCDAILYGRPDFSVKNVKKLLIKMENDKLLSGLRNCTKRKEKSGDSTNITIEGFDDSDASSNSIEITGDTGNEQILDSNPSYHMTPNQRFSSSYKKQEIKVKLGSRRKIPIEGK